MQGVLKNALATLDEIYAISIYSNDGTIMASYMPDRIGKKLIDADLQYGPYREQANQAVLAGKEFYCHSYAPALKEMLHIVMVPIPIGNSDTTWSIMMGSADSFMLKEVNAITRFTIILAVIAIAGSAVIVYFVLSGTTKPISIVAEILKSVAEGDLTRSVNVSSKDEIGQLANDFASTVDKIKHMVVNIRNQSNTLSKIGADLSSNMTETAAAINQITANIQNIKGRVLSQSASVNEITRQVKGSSEEMLEGSKEIMHESQNLEKVTQEITGGMNEMASGADQINAAVHDVNEMTGKNREAIDNLIKEVSRFRVE
jgi:methyl-accepting chemotaxis protein